VRAEILLLAWVIAGLVAACTARAPERTPGGSATSPVLAKGSFTAELNSFRIHYEVHGQGRVLMALPNSWGLSLDGLRALFRPLEEGLTLVYFDPRGMGGSDPVRKESDRGMAAVRADFQALRLHLGLDEVAAIGWSNGAMNLIHLAHEQPATLSAAIFVHGVASFTAEDGRRLQETNPELTKRYAAFLRKVDDPAKTPEEKTRLLRQMWLEEYFPMTCADPEAMRPRIAEAFKDAQFSWAHVEYTNKEAGTFDARGALASIPVRSLVIAGAHDLLPPERVKALADGLPSATLQVFARSGHFAPIEEPEAFKAAVYRFLGVSPTGSIPEVGGRF
jgi:proline iminopeptidase